MPQIMKKPWFWAAVVGGAAVVTGGMLYATQDRSRPGWVGLGRSGPAFLGCIEWPPVRTRRQVSRSPHESPGTRPALPALALAAPPPTPRRVSALLIPMDQGAEATAVKFETYMNEALEQFRASR